jgi:hypothetical protein
VDKRNEWGWVKVRLSRVEHGKIKKILKSSMNHEKTKQLAYELHRTLLGIGHV